MAAQQGAILASLIRWYTPAEALAMATGTNAELLALSGKRNPYPGKLGVVEEGALADLLLVEGNPLENIDLVADPANNFKIIMKDGVIYKNTLSRVRKPKRAASVPARRSFSRRRFGVCSQPSVVLSEIVGAEARRRVRQRGT